MRLLGIDPGLGRTGWGVIDVEGNRLGYVASGVISSTAALSLAERLVQIKQGLELVINAYNPHEAAVEETFVNGNPASALKLGQARGVALLIPAAAGLLVAEYSPNKIKKAVTGAGHAAKEQIQAMVRILLPGCDIGSADAADALATAICHAHYRETAGRVALAEARA